LNGSSEFLNWEAIALKIIVDFLEEIFGHTRRSIEDPEVAVVGASDN
jgi:hypothetical protein